MYIYIYIPKAPDPSYGNTRPSVHDTPGALKKQVGFDTPSHPMEP